MQQHEEIVHLKKKTQEHKKKEEELERIIKSCREQATLLEHKLAARPRDDKPKDKCGEAETKEELERLTEKYRQLENAKRMNDKSSRHEIDSLQLKLRQTERELAEAQEVLSKKDKDSHIILFRLKEKERKRFSTLEPISTARYSQEVLHTSSHSLFDTRKEFRGLAWGQGIYREFDDGSKLPLEKNYRIKRLTFTYFEEHILSLIAEYDVLEGEGSQCIWKESRTVESFAIPTQFASIKIAEHIFGDFEYIAGMELFCGRGIEFLRLVTSKEHILEVGNPKSLPRCKQHTFDIAPHEKPIAVLGIIEHRKVAGENREFLVNLGLELRKKGVVGRGVSRKVESSLNRSMLVRHPDDKNPKA
jgi:hypothetical protein